MGTNAVPRKIAVHDAPVRAETPSFRLATLVDRSTAASELLLGVEWMDPGDHRISWHAPSGTHETYYVVQGKLRISWDGEGSGSADLGPQDGFYFPPDRTYTLENIGSEQVFLVYSVVPSPT